MAEFNEWHARAHQQANNNDNDHEPSAVISLDQYTTIRAPSPDIRSAESESRVAAGMVNEALTSTRHDFIPPNSSSGSMVPTINGIISVPTYNFIHRPMPPAVGSHPQRQAQDPMPHSSSSRAPRGATHSHGMDRHLESRTSVETLHTQPIPEMPAASDFEANSRMMTGQRIIPEQSQEDLDAKRVSIGKSCIQYIKKSLRMPDYVWGTSVDFTIDIESESRVTLQSDKRCGS